tara:strand:- start:3158 stop:4306 length:1149 start_codon:yes stop_codon:yes gene_type:complete
MAPIKSTAFGYSSSSSDKVETDNNIAGIGATYSTNNVSEPGNGYRYLYYTSPGILTVTRGGNVDVAVIAGGGSGGGGGYYPPSTVYAGGGGGAGGVFQDFNYPFPIGEYTITVGNGGGTGGSTQAPTHPLNRMGNPGQPSTIIGPGISSITAVGGGAGGSATDAHPSSGTWPGYWGDDGGSGGGNGWIGPSPQYPNGFFPLNGRLNDTVSSGNALVQRGPASTPGYAVSPIPASPVYNPNSPGAVQGYPAGSSQPPYDGGASGGGGAGGPSGTPNYRFGGVGVTLWTNDPGIPPSYGTPGPTPGRWFAGGGGAGDPGSSAVANGGAGGGGSGMDYAPSSLRPSSNPEVPGVANTGGGGGGGHSSAAGAVGGSGIVIIRYKIS